MAREQAPFPVVRLRGYDITQVNAFLRAAIAERRRLSAENEQLREQLNQKSTELATREPVTASTLVSADHAASILAAAQRTAELTVAEARHQAAETLRSAVERAEALAEASEKQLAQTREQLQATQARLIGLQSLETEYRSRLRTWASGVLIELDDGAPATPRSTASGYSVDFGAVDDLGESDGLMTTYHVDVANGEIRFGDGIEGERPDAGSSDDQFGSTYRTGNGAYGVVPEGAPDYANLNRPVDLDPAHYRSDAEAPDDHDPGEYAPYDVASGHDQSGADEPDLDIPAAVFAPVPPNRAAHRPARSWFAPVGSPHRPPGV
jgi:hypothetical protein